MAVGVGLFVVPFVGVIGVNSVVPQLLQSLGAGVFPASAWWGVYGVSKAAVPPEERGEDPVSSQVGRDLWRESMWSLVMMRVGISWGCLSPKRR